MGIDQEANVLQPVHPLMVQIIENNLLLKEVRAEVKEIRVEQQANHQVAVALTTHDTIARTDKIWVNFQSFRFLLRLIAGVLALIPITAAGATASHFLWGWPN